MIEDRLKYKIYLGC